MEIRIYPLAFAEFNDAYDMTSEEKQTQELNSLRNIPDLFKKIVIVNGTKKPWRN